MVVELAVRPGQLDNFVELTREMVEATAEEAGVLAYQRFVGDDGATVHAVERYQSSAAAVAHLETFRERFAERFSRLATRRRFTVYGTASAELKSVLDGFGAIYLEPLADLAYWPPARAS